MAETSVSEATSEIAISPDGRAVTLTGAQTLQEADRIRAVLLDALDREPPPRIDVSGVTEADTAFAQVLLSGARLAAARGRRFRLAGADRGPLPALLSGLGLIAADGDPARLFEAIAQPGVPS